MMGGGQGVLNKKEESQKCRVRNQYVFVKNTQRHKHSGDGNQSTMGWRTMWFPSRPTTSKLPHLTINEKAIHKDNIISPSAPPRLHLPSSSPPPPPLSSKPLGGGREPKGVTGWGVVGQWWRGRGAGKPKATTQLA